jgi:magnesium transporter
LDERRHLAGVLDLAELIAARDRALLQRLMRPAGAVLNVRAALHTVTNHPAWLTHESLPVINRDGVFQGVLERSRVTKEETQLPAEIAEVNELKATRTALADIFWMGVGAFLAGDKGPVERNKKDLWRSDPPGFERDRTGSRPILVHRIDDGDRHCRLLQLSRNRDAFLELSLNK